MARVKAEGSRGAVAFGPKTKSALARTGFQRLPSLPAGWLAIASSEGEIVFGLLDGPPQEQALDIGWEELDRPKQQKALNHTQEPLDSWVLPLVFDGWSGGDSVESALAVLHRMVRKPNRAEDPPTVRVGGVGPISPKRDWAITNLDPQDVEGSDGKTLWAGGRTRRRAKYNVTITELVLPRLVKVRPAKATRDRQGKRGTTIYTVKAGDTAQRIALSYLGDASRWRDLKVKKGKKLVALRDPDSLRAGQRLQLP